LSIAVLELLADGRSDQASAAGFVAHRAFSKSDNSDKNMPGDTRRSPRQAFIELGVEDMTSRRCDNCGAEMKHLSDLPGHLGAAPIRIYSCDRCNRVVSESR